MLAIRIPGWWRWCARRCRGSNGRERAWVIKVRPARRVNYKGGHNQTTEWLVEAIARGTRQARRILGRCHRCSTCTTRLRCSPADKWRNAAPATRRLRRWPRSVDGPPQPCIEPAESPIIHLCVGPGCNPGFWQGRGFGGTCRALIQYTHSSAAMRSPVFKSR